MNSHGLAACMVTRLIELISFWLFILVQKLELCHLNSVLAAMYALDKRTYAVLGVMCVML